MPIVSVKTTHWVEHQEPGETPGPQGDCQRLDRADHEAFLSFVAHEVRNPLVPIQNAVELLRLPKTTDRQKQRAIEIIETQVLELRRLLDNLLDAARIARGNIELVKQPIGLDNLFTRVVEICRPMIETQGHRLGVALPAEPVWLMADAARLVQVVSGLLDHAAKSCADGGAIQLSSTIEEEEVVVVVEDNGRGIRAEDLPHVFDLFFQPRQSDRNTCAESGVGLAVVRKLVELHGGEVEAQSEGLGRGAKFLVRLPRLSRSETLGAVESTDFAKSILRLPALRVFIVVDDTEFANDWCLLLRVAGHEAHTARAGHDTLATARDFQPHVVCLDIDGPRMDVREITRQLRESPGLAKALVIAITGTKNLDIHRAALASGCASVLVKPVKIRDFLRSIVTNADRLGDVPETTR